MEFCEKCGSRMVTDKGSLRCLKCGNVVRLGASATLKKEKKRVEPEGIYVYADQKSSNPEAIRECLKCGNKKVFHWLSGTSGEHAGIRRERTVHHFKCTKCAHTWAEEY